MVLVTYKLFWQSVYHRLLQYYRPDRWEILRLLCSWMTKVEYRICRKMEIMNSCILTQEWFHNVKSLQKWRWMILLILMHDWWISNYQIVNSVATPCMQFFYIICTHLSYCCSMLLLNLAAGHPTWSAASNWAGILPFLRKFCIPLYCQASLTEISERNSTTLCQTVDGKSRNFL